MEGRSVHIKWLAESETKYNFPMNLPTGFKVLESHLKEVVTLRKDGCIHSIAPSIFDHVLPPLTHSEA
uniref:Uncharacterized protein n=1 Tax=Oryza punctata TaxID=4537 RepID=A0A0E0MJ91_ORYPU